MGQLLIEKLSARLLGGISNANSSEEIKRECLDNMSELLKRFGHLSNEASNSEISNTIIKQLQHDKAVIRKKAAACLVPPQPAAPFTLTQLIVFNTGILGCGIF